MILACPFNCKIYPLIKLRQRDRGHTGLGPRAATFLCCRIYRMPSLAAACAVAERRRQAEGGGIGIGGGGGGGGAALDLASTFYMLNPSGDLAATQAAFEERFSSQAGWEVRAAVRNACHRDSTSEHDPISMALWAVGLARS